jgi:hypothetical protein
VAGRPRDCLMAAQLALFMGAEQRADDLIQASM